MDWFHWLLEGGAVACGALGIYKAKRTDRRAQATAEQLAGAAAEATIDLMIAKAADIERELGRAAAGLVVLEKLEQGREAAIAAGKAKALEQHRATRRPAGR